MKEFDKVIKSNYKGLLLGSLLMMNVAPNLSARPVFLSMELGQYRPISSSVNLTLKDAFNKLEEQGVFVFYSDIDSPNKVVKMSQGAKSLKAIMDELLEGTNNTYTLEGNQVYVKRRVSSSTTSTERLAQQELEASGRVTDINGRPIPGASIIVEGTKIATSTDATGRFKIKVPSGSAKLVVKSVGYISATVSAGLDIKVFLEDQSTAIEDVVVTGGYENR